MAAFSFSSKKTDSLKWWAWHNPCLHEYCKYDFYPSWIVLPRKQGSILVAFFPSRVVGKFFSAGNMEPLPMDMPVDDSREVAETSASPRSHEALLEVSPGGSVRSIRLTGAQ